MPLSSKRAEHVALGALFISALFFLITFLVGRWTEFYAVYATSWLILDAALIWLVLTIEFHQRTLAEQEKLDMQQMAETEKGHTIFEQEKEKAQIFAVAQKRLKTFQKWFLPVFAALLAAYQLGIGLYLFNTLPKISQMQTQRPLICLVCMMGISFVTFLLSRYATGMSAKPQWRPLRAGASLLLAVTILSFILGICLALANWQIFTPVYILQWVAPALLVVLGAETALNIILDIYRPRITGVYQRAAFDSRLLGIINEPGGVFRSLAGAIDYQFGFKVSQTWFYQLLERTIIPLILFAAITMYLLTAVVVVNSHEQAIVEHFGNPLDREGNVRILKPGIDLKWPWPVDIAYKYPVKKIMEISVGFVPEQDPEKRFKPRLWRDEHYKEEYDLLVASEQLKTGQDEAAYPFSIIKAAIPVQYRVKDLYAFLYNHKNTEEVLENICYHELTKFAASSQIEMDTPQALEKSLLGAGREHAKRDLTKRIQRAADRKNLGVQIVLVGLQGIHPPSEIADAYQKVIAAVQQKQADILAAQAHRNKTLSELAGSMQKANQLYDIALEYQQAEKQNDPEQIKILGRKLDDALETAEGDIFKILRESQSYKFERIAISKATGERFAGQLKGFQAAPAIYQQQQRLLVLEKALQNIRKYLVAVANTNIEVIIIDLQEELTPELLELAGVEEGS